MNIPEGAKSLDLQAALAGAKTICRDGSPGPVELSLAADWANFGKPLFARFSDGRTQSYSKEGVFDPSGFANGVDLFMAPVEKEITAWAIVDKRGELFGARYKELDDVESFNKDYPDLAPFTIVPLTGKWKG